MAAENPFVYGEIVPPEAFVGRAAELERLTTDLASGQKVFLISPRRYGKSSLVHQAAVALQRRRIQTLEFTVSSFSSYVAFLEGYARALVSMDTRQPATSSWLAALFPSVRPEVRDERGRQGGAVSLAFPAIRTPKDAARLADEVFSLPARLAERRNRRLVIALDEFQALTGFGGGSVEEALRAAVQQQRQVGYVFAGSEPRLMEQMIGPRRPFYKAGPVMRLQKIAAAVFSRFIEDRFKASGITPRHGLGAAIVDLAGNLPYDVQRLAHETWDDVFAARRKRADLDDLHATLHRLLAEHDMLFETVWQRQTLPQRSVLRAVVIEHGVSLLAADTRDRHRLGGASTVQAALAALQREDLVTRDDDGRYVVVDSLMREWIARKTY